MTPFVFQFTSYHSIFTFNFGDSINPGVPHTNMNTVQCNAKLYKYLFTEVSIEVAAFVTFVVLMS